MRYVPSGREKGIYIVMSDTYCNRENMPMDRIVFNQTELDAVMGAGQVIALCDNKYVISPSDNTSYISIGEVSAVVGCTAIETLSMGMTFIGFTPVFLEKGKALKPKAAACEVRRISSFASSFKSSFASSFGTSFASSFATSFSSMYEYEYEFRIASSFSGSFGGSFGGSYVTGSFKNVSSFGVGSARAIKKQAVREIAVNGYGLNLI